MTNDAYFAYVNIGKQPGNGTCILKGISLLLLNYAKNFKGIHMTS